MAENDEILGISGHLDITDIDKAVDKVVDDLNRVGQAAKTSGKQMGDSATQAANDYKKAGKDVENASNGIEDAFKKIAAAAGIAFGVAQLKQWATQVMMIRGEFQQLEVAFKTMLGSAEKADKLMGQIVKTAATTPFDLKGVAAGAKSLMAYGTAAEDVNEMLVRLGDIAAGMSIPLNDLVYLYGTTMVQGRMFTQDLRQFQGRGIPIAEELANVLGVAKEKIPELVTAGKVTADVFDKAIHNMTDAGSKFGGLMDAQSKTITGKISNIEDALDTMMNNIGKSQEGTINAALNGVSALVENYETVGKVIIGLISTYGVYKAATMTVTAMQALQTAGVGALTTAETIHYGWLVMVEKAQKLLNATMLANPYVAVGTAIAGLVAMMWAFGDSSTAAEKANARLTKTLDDLAETQKKYNEETQKAIDLAQDDSAATLDRNEALQTLIGRYREIIKKYIDEKGHLTDIVNLKKEIAELDGKRQREERTETLRKEGEDASKMYQRLKELRKKGGDKLTTAEKKELRTIVSSYIKETGKHSYSIGGITEYYKEKAAQGKTKYNRQVTENRIEDFTKEGGTLEKYTDAQLKALQKDLRNANTKKYEKTSVFIKELSDYLTYEDRKSLLTQVEGMLDARNKPKSTVSKQKDDAKKALDKAKEELKKFDAAKTELTVEEAQKQRQKLQDAVEEAEKEYKKYGGNIKSDDKDEKDDANRKAKRIADELAYRDNLKKITIEGERAAKDAVIASIKNNAERERAERKEQHRRTLENIALQEAEIYKEIYQQRKNDYENSNKDKRYENTDAGAAGWSPDKMKGTLSDKEKKYFNERNKANKGALDKETEEWNRYLREVQEAQEKSLLEYIRTYGSIQQQKEAIAKEYDLKIAEAADVIQKEALERQKENALSELDMKELRASIDWETIFNDLQRQSTDALISLKEKLRKALDAKDITAENAKTIAEKIKEIEDTLRRRKNPIEAWLPGLRERKRLTQDILEIETQISALGKERDKKRGKVESARENLVSVLSENTKIRKDEIREQWNDFGAGTSLEEILQFFDLKVATQELIEAFALLRATTGDLDNAEENLNQAERKKDSKQDALNNFTKGGSIGQYFKDITQGMGFDGYVSLVNDNVQSMNDLVKNIGLSNTEFGKGVEEFAKGTQGFANAVQAFAKGDVVGAVNGIVEGLQGYGSVIERVGGFSFNGSNADEINKEIAELTQKNQDLIHALDYLREEIRAGRLGDALDNYARAIDYQSDIIKNQRRILNDEMDYHGAHHSFGYYWEDEWLSGYKGKKGLENWSGSLRDLTPEEAAVLSSYSEVRNLIRNTGKGGYGDSVLRALDELAEMAGKLDEITKVFYERITSVGFDTMYSSFVEKLKNMDAKTKDFANDFEGYLRDAIYNGMSEEQIKPLLQQWYAAFASFMSNGILDEEERYKLLHGGGTYTDLQTGEEKEFKSKDAITEVGLMIRDSIETLGLYNGKETNGQNSASYNSANNITYEQADSMVGVATSQMLILEKARTLWEKSLVEAENHTTSLISISETLKVAGSDIGSIKEGVQTIIDTQSSMNKHLSEIAANTNVLPEVRDEIVRVRKLVEEQ